MSYLKSDLCRQSHVDSCLNPLCPSYQSLFAPFSQRGFVIGAGSRGWPVEGPSDHGFVVDYSELVMDVLEMCVSALFLRDAHCSQATGWARKSWRGWKSYSGLRAGGISWFLIRGSFKPDPSHRNGSWGKHQPLGITTVPCRWESAWRGRITSSTAWAGSMTLLPERGHCRSQRISGVISNRVTLIWVWTAITRCWRADAERSSEAHQVI